MGLFSRRKQQPEKQNSSAQLQNHSASPSTSELPNKLKKPERAPYELSGQSSGTLYNGNDDAETAAKQKIMLELQLARQRTYIRDLEAREMSMKQTVAFSTQAQLGIPQEFVDLSTVEGNSSYHAPEVVVGGMDLVDRASGGYSHSGSGALISQHDGAPTQHHESPTFHHATPQQHQQSQPPRPQSPSVDFAKIFAAISTLPWSKAFGLLAENSSNPGLVLVLLALLYFTYSIIMTRAMYLLLAFVISIAAYTGHRIFFIAKQAEVHNEYMRSIAPNLQTIEAVPPNINNSRLLLPPGVNRVDELN